MSIKGASNYEIKNTISFPQTLITGWTFKATTNNKDNILTRLEHSWKILHWPWDNFVKKALPALLCSLVWTGTLHWRYQHDPFRLSWKPHGWARLVPAIKGATNYESKYMLSFPQSIRNTLITGCTFKTTANNQDNLLTWWDHSWNIFHWPSNNIHKIALPALLCSLVWSWALHGWYQLGPPHQCWNLHVLSRLWPFTEEYR